MQKNNVYSMLIEKANKDFGIPEQFAKGQLRNSVWSSLWAMVSYADIVDVIMCDLRQRWAKQLQQIEKFKQLNAHVYHKKDGGAGS